MIEIKVPSVGESISGVEIGEWLKKEGDAAAQDETLVMLDSAKTTVELPSPAAGVISQILKKTGETANVGDVIGLIEDGANGSGSTPASSKSDAKAEAKTQPKASGEPTPEWEKPATPEEEERAEKEQSVVAKPAAADKSKSAEETNSANGFVMPAAQRVLHEKGLEAKDAQASGPGGRVLKEDALAATKQETAPKTESPKAETATQSTLAVAGEDEELVPMTMLRRHIAARLVEAQQTAALLTTFNEIDMSAIMQLRKEHQDAFTKKYNIKLGFMSFFVKATVDALKQVPQINAEIRGKDMVFKNHYDIGVAIGSGKGLVVPVLRNAERLSFAEVELGIADFAARIKENKLMPDELAGGTFTITNGGIFGSLLSTPIVNPPQSGILGMHTIQERPVARNGEVVIRPMMYVALTYDHRIVDGREAVQFLVRIKDCIENPARMLMEV